MYDKWHVIVARWNGRSIRIRKKRARLDVSELPAGAYALRVVWGDEAF